MLIEPRDSNDLRTPTANSVQKGYGIRIWQVSRIVGRVPYFDGVDSRLHLGRQVVAAKNRMGNDGESRTTLRLLDELPGINWLNPTSQSQREKMEPRMSLETEL